MGWISEEIERAALEDLLKAASTQLSESLGIKGLELGSAFVSIASELPDSAIVLNRAIGVGLSSPETLDAVRQIVEAYQLAAVGRYFIQIHPEAGPNKLME